MSVDEMALHLQFLGGFQASSTEPRQLPQAQQKVIGLLAFLALEAERAHSRETLSGLLWSELPEENARNNLRVTLARLRKWLGTVSLPDSLLNSTRIDVQFQRHEAVRLDVVTFLELLAQTESHAHASRAHCVRCQEQLVAAAELYRGPFLDGFFLSDCPAFEEWLFVWRERLHLQMMELLEELADGLLDANRFAEATAYTRRQLELDSLRDSAHQRLLRLLAYQGRQGKALTHYKEYTRLLDEELGLAPDAGVIRLVQQIEKRRLVLPGEPADTAGQRHRLPENLTPFVGRARELSLLTARLAEPGYRLISLVGPGGIGKTRLAVEAARNNVHRFEDGVFFVPLEGVASIHDVPGAIAEAMGAPFAGGEPPAKQIVRLLRNKRTLLILDNLEHLMGSVPLLLEIVASGPRVLLLVTSRERLNVQIEDLFRLKGLPFPADVEDKAAADYAAVRLFGDRARRLNKEFSLDEGTLRHVVRICQTVEGLPLGLELAATWSRDMDIAALAEALAQDVALLETDLRDVDPRHQSIQSVFEYSWHLLSAAEQAILPLLALFKGSFSGQAAATIFGASALTLTRLRYKSLIRGEGMRRYSMHELLRQLAARHLPAALDGYKARFWAYYFEGIRREAPKLRTFAAREAARAFAADVDNVRQAWQWALEGHDFDALKGTIPALVRFYHHSGYYRQGIGLVDDVLRQLPAAEKDKRPYFLVEKAYLLARAYEGRLPQQEPIIEELLGIAPHLTSIRARALAYYSEALFIDSIDSERSRSTAEEAMRLAQQIGDTTLIARLHLQLGSLHYRFEDTEAAITEIGEALALYEEQGDMRGVASAYEYLSVAYYESGNMVKPLAYVEKLLALYSQLGLEMETADAQYNLAHGYAALGKVEEAQSLLAEATNVYRKYGDEAAVQNVYAAMGRNAFALGDDEQAIAHYREAIRLQERLQMRSRLCNDLTGYSMPLRRAGHLDEAQMVLERAIRVSVAPRYKIQAEAHLAYVLLKKGRREEALPLASALWERIRLDEGQRLPSVLRTLKHIFQVFAAVGEKGAAREVLRLAQREITQTSDEIEDPSLMESYLTRQQQVLFFRPHLERWELGMEGSREVE